MADPNDSYRIETETDVQNIGLENPSGGETMIPLGVMTRNRRRKLNTAWDIILWIYTTKPTWKSLKYRYKTFCRINYFFIKPTKQI